MRGLEKEYMGRVKFVWVNVLDDSQTTATLIQQYSFNVTPEVYLAGADGKVIGFWDEVTEADPLRLALDEALAQR